MKQRNNKKNQFWKFRAAAGLFLCLAYPSNLRADGFLPVAMVIWPSMILALIPVVLIEAAVYMKNLKISRKKAIVGSLISNSISTVLGYPLSVTLWVFLAWIFFGVFFKKNDPTFGHKGIETLIWSLFAWGDSVGYQVAGLAFGIIPAFLLSVWSERLVMQWYLKKSKEELRHTIWKANLFSYLFLIVLTVYLVASVGPEFGVSPLLRH